MAAAVSALARDGGVRWSALRTTRLLIFSGLLFLATGADVEEDLQKTKALLERTEQEMDALEKRHASEHRRLSDGIHENELVINGTLEKIAAHPMLHEETKHIKVKVLETVVANNLMKEKLHKLTKTYNKGLKFLKEKLEIGKAVFAFHKRIYRKEEL